MHNAYAWACKEGPEGLSRKTLKIGIRSIIRHKTRVGDTVIQSCIESCVLLVLSIFCVGAIYIGTIPTGFKTTSSAMLDLSMGRTKSSGIKGRSIIFNVSYTFRLIL